MVNDYIKNDDLILFTSGSRFALGAVYLQEGYKNVIANFDLFIRELPKNRNYLVFAGLEHIANFLINLRFTKEQLKWLKKTYDFPAAIMGYYKDFRFTGDMQAMPEGSIFFANEPVIRITAPIIEAQMIEVYLTNTVFLQTILASKISRFVQATNEKKAILGFNRCYGTDTATKLDRVGKIIGISQPAMALTSFRNSHLSTYSTGTFHHFIVAFDSELEAFKAYLKYFPHKGSILVDTYNTIQGIKNFTKVAQEVKRATGKAPKSIMLDSGDLYKLSKIARKILDNSGLKEVQIMALSNLDEYKVAQLRKRKAPIDTFGGTTEILTPRDAPVLEVVYKLSEIVKNGKTYPKMKLSVQKLSLPGKKQVYRIAQDKKYQGDVIGLDNEKIQGSKMLIPIIKNGKLVYQFPSLNTIHNYYQKECTKFKEALFWLNRRIDYPVSLSISLKNLIKNTKSNIKKIHHL